MPGRLLKQVGDGFSGVRVQTWGGYPEAERQRACVLPADSWDDRPDFGIAILRITPLDPGGENPSHRDYLGSMLGLGLKREKLGDCLVRSGEALFCVAAEIADFVRFNLSRVGRWTVNVELVAAGEDLPAPPPPRVKTVTVASPRLDAVIAAAFNLSRSRAAELIRQGRMNLNWRLETGPDAQVKTGDTLSCRGQGRFMLLENSGPTRRGRQRLHLGFPADPAPKNS